MNELVVNMNKALSDAVGRAGDGVTFVDYDKYYQLSRGRFCEDKYKETEPNRYGLLFYEWNTDDNAEVTDGQTASAAAQESGSFTPSLVMNGTFEGAINEYVRKAIEKDPSLADHAAKAQGSAPDVNSVQATDEQKAIGFSSNLVPDGYGRVFHPRPNGHAMIANLVLDHVSRNYAKRINQDWPAEEITSDTCPANAAGTSPSPTPSGPAPSPSCDTNALSGIPNNVFHGSGTGSTDVYGKFCDAVSKDQKNKLEWTTDASGTQKTRKLRSMKRTPPPNPNAYDSYSFDLKFEPSGDGTCSKSCSDAYAYIANSNCGQQGGTQNGMTAKGSLDVGCGTYSYEITGKDVPAVSGPPKPFLTAQYCFPDAVFGDHGDIQPDFVNEYAGYACAGTALPDRKIKKGDPSTFIYFNTTTNNVPYVYSAVWEDNCESSETEMSLWQPLPDDDKTTCTSMFTGDYKDCKSCTSWELWGSQLTCFDRYIQPWDRRKRQCRLCEV